MKEFDLIVIGSGSGLDVASAYARRGHDVAVVEPGRLGGTCLNRGCIPSKMLIHHADIVETVDDSERFHIDAEINDVDFQEIIEEVNETVREDSKSIEEGIRSSDQHTLYRTEASFVDDKTLEVDGEEITAEKIVVAAGSRPLVPPIDGIENVDYLTSKEALRLDEKPEEMVIVGGGYISAELAHFYDAMGTEITILEMNDRLLNREDREVSEKFTELARNKYNVETGVRAEELDQDGDSKMVRASRDGEELEFEADEILIAAGRRPNTDKLEVDETSIETDDRGFVETDEYLETSVEGVYALGDIAGNYMFKHSANLEAEHVFRNSLAGNSFPVDYTAMPHAVFSSPQVAGVGKTEQELEEEDYVSATYEYSKTGMGLALKEEDGFVKVLASEEGDILGCHIIGPEASTLVHEVLVSMRKGSGKVSDIKDTVHVHPALNEVVQRAFNQVK
jgi:dihydrolipoamide dehydrogenase